ASLSELRVCTAERRPGSSKRRADPTGHRAGRVRARGWRDWRCDRHRTAPSEGAQPVAEYTLLFHMVVVGVERGTVFLEPLRAFVPADGFEQAGLDCLRQVELEAPRPVEQVVIDAEVGRFLAPAR